MFVGTGNSEPWIWLRGAKAEVTPQRRFYWGIIPLGNAVELINTNGDWFFTGGVHID